MRLRTTLLIGLLAAMVPCAAQADVFVLAGGGRVEGQLLNPTESPRETYVVRTAAGRVTLTESQVRKVVVKSDVERGYDVLLAAMPDTLDAHWKMAEWCLKADLKKQRAYHLEQVLRFDPDHEDARRRLGYVRLKGQWLTQAESRQRQGYVLHLGQWQLPQAMLVETSRQKTEDAEKDWTGKLKMWRGWLDSNSPDRRQQALEEIRLIRDPAAAVGLGEMLLGDDPKDYRLLYVEVLGRLESAAAIDAMIKAAMEDSSETVVDSCIVQLKLRGRARAVAFLVKELQSKDNRRVNRAALALGRLGDPAATVPLIDALVTKHQFDVKTGNGGATSATFGRSSNGSGLNGFSAGGGVKRITREIPNQAVLDALLTLTDGVNFTYNEEQWKSWYVRENTPRLVNLRRDP